MKKSVFLAAMFLACLLSCKANAETKIEIKDYYVPAAGEVVLDSSKSFESQVKDSGKTYVIRDGFDLKNAQVSIPSNCVLKFFGGTIKNGTISFNQTTITSIGGEIMPVFYNCSYAGSLANSEVELGWFYVEDGKTHSYGSSTFKSHDADKIQQIINCCKSGAVLNINGIYCIRKALKISKKISIKGYDKSEGIYANRIIQNMEYGFFTVMNNSAFVVEAGGDISVQGLSVVGNVSLYISGNLYEKFYPNGNTISFPVTLCGIDVKKGGKITEIHDSSFVGFTYGIRCIEGSIGLIKNSYMSSNRFGFWAKDSSNFELRGCRLNTNLLNFHFYEKSLNDTNPNQTSPTTETDAADIAKLGGGLYLNNCTNVEIINCRFEFNFIHAILDNTNKNINIHNAIFDTGTLAQIMINNQGTGSYSSSNPAFSNVKINSCTFARGARCDVQKETSHSGFGIFYICDIGNRGAKIEITNNIISDDMEVNKKIDAVYEKAIFDIYNTSTSGTNYTVRGNSFYNTEAESIYNVVSGSSGAFNITAKDNDFDALTITQTTGVTSVLKLSE